MAQWQNWWIPTRLYRSGFIAYERSEAKAVLILHRHDQVFHDVVFALRRVRTSVSRPACRIASMQVGL
jgi:hypothetical protein